MHAKFCSTLNINVDLIRLFDCINCIIMFGSELVGCAQTHGNLQEGREERRIEGRREVAWIPNLHRNLRQCT